MKRRADSRDEREKKGAKALENLEEIAKLESSLFGTGVVSTLSVSSNNISSSSSSSSSTAAWHDADDKDVVVNLASTSRLRKLRKSNDESTISGEEYSVRLREHFARAAIGEAGGTGGVVKPVDESSSSSWARIPVASLGKSTEKNKNKNKKKSLLLRTKVSSPENSNKGDDDGDEEEEEEEVEEEDAFLRSSAPLISSRSTTTTNNITPPLPSGILGLTRLRDANAADPSRATLRALEFHPSGSVLMTASLDHKMRFFALDGKKNSKLASVFFEDMPISSACWTGGDGAEVIATGRRPFFYTYDVASGKAHKIPRILGRDEKSLERCIVSPAPTSYSTSMIAFLGSGGSTILCSSRTKQWLGNVKMEGSVRDAAFSRGPTGGARGAGPLEYPELITVGTSGEVFRWDLRTLKCLSRHVDEGSSGSTTVATSPNGESYAVGSTSGVVNTYDASIIQSGGVQGGWFSGQGIIKPSKTILNLTTNISSLRYNHDGSMLMMASQSSKDQLKLLHTTSGTVFSNWPTEKTPLHFVTCATFSPHGGFLTIGNDRGRALLYRLHHYNQI
jgi:U3 small nucleolar RNA-associated protein 18